MTTEHRLLVEQAERVGIETSYWDTRGERHDAGTEALLAVLRSLGHDVHDPTDALTVIGDHVDERAAAGPGVVVVWGARPLRVALDIGSRTRTLDIVLALEDGSTRQSNVEVADLPMADPAGRLIELDGPLPVGYHKLQIGKRAPIDVLVAPERVRRARRARAALGALRPGLRARGRVGSGGPHRWPRGPGRGAR